MIKTSAIFSAHAIHVLLRNTLIFLVVLFIAFFMWLLAGIKFDTFKVADYNVAGLYIKLDKKLILKAENVIIPQSKSDPSFNSVDETFERIKYLLTFFQHIELKKIVFQNNTLAIDFHDDLLMISSDDYTIIGSLARDGKILKASIPLLELKQHNITLSGKLRYDLDEDILTTGGTFTINGASGKFTASKEKNEIDFGLSSDTFRDLESIIEKFHLQEVVRSWVVDKVKADKYKLVSLRGKGTMEDRTFKMDFEALKGEVLFSDVKIFFHEDLSPVLAPSFILSYREGGLYFDLKEPIYEGISLRGSEVSILNLLNSHTNLKLKIRTENPYDSTMQHLLKAYDLELGLNQTSGKVKVLFMADLGLKNDYKDFYVHVDLSRGDLWIDKIKLPVEKGNVQYQKGFVTLKDVYLKDVHYEGKANGTIDLENKKADLTFDAKTITLGDEKEKFFVLHDQKLPFELNYANNLEVEIPALAMHLKNDENETLIRLRDLNKIKPYLPDPGPIENGGDMEIRTKDFKTYTYKGVLKRTSCFLYEKDDQCKSRVPVEGKVLPSNVVFYAFDKRLHYSSANSRVKLSNINIDLEKFIQAHENENKEEKTKKKDQSKQGKSLIIIGKNSNLRYASHTLITDSYDIEVKPNGDIKAIGISSGDIIKFSRNKSIHSMQALRIKDKVLHPLINFKGLQHGRYSLKKSGDPEGTMKGEIIVEGGVMKDFKAYNNTLAFINTIPALASLENPGYSAEGFTIEEGVAEYRMIKSDKIIFDSIYIKGTSATIAGTGEIDLKKKTITLDLAIQTAREIGKFVGSLPLVGHILMGEDKSMTFGLEIRGTLDDPKVNTSAGGDILSLPLKIIKRALESSGNITKQQE